MFGVDPFFKSFSEIAFVLLVLNLFRPLEMYDFTSLFVAKIILNS